MTSTMKVVKGDYGYYLNFTVSYTTGGYYDLTDKTVTLKVADPSSGTNLFSVDCELVDPTGGTCRYQMTSANAFKTVGRFKAELEITDELEEGEEETEHEFIFTVPNISIIVINDMPSG